MRCDKFKLRELVDGINNNSSVYGVKCCRRLIHKNRLGLHRKNRRNRSHSFLAAGNAMIISVLKIHKIQTFKNLIHFIFSLLFSHFVIKRSEHHILKNRWHKELVIRILQHKTQLSSYIRKAGFFNKYAIHQNLTLARSQKPQHNLHDGRFPGAVGTNQPNRLTVIYRKGNTFKHRRVLVV